MADVVTMPLEVVGNRSFLSITLSTTQAERSARFFIDTGGGGFLLTEPIARELGITWGETIQEQGSEFGLPDGIPEVSLGDFALTLDPNRVLVAVGRENMLPPSAPSYADGMLPGHVLAQYHVVFDYPRGAFALGENGSMTPEGDPLAMPVGSPSGFPRTVLGIDGTEYGFLLDTGASFTMVSEVLLTEWGEAHPEWSRHEGAVGDAITLGGQTIETMIIPRATWGPLGLTDVGVVSQREGTFEQWMSSMMAAPIGGALGGNVLKQFRVELDYSNESLYLSE